MVLVIVSHGGQVFLFKVTAGNSGNFWNSRCDTMKPRNLKLLIVMCLLLHSPAKRCDCVAAPCCQTLSPKLFFCLVLFFLPKVKTCTIETTLPASQHKGAKALWHLPACLLYPSTRVIPKQLLNLGSAEIFPKREYSQKRENKPNTYSCLCEWKTKK